MTAALRAGGQAGSIAPNCKTIPILRRKSYCQARKSKGRDCGSAVTVSQSVAALGLLHIIFAICPALRFCAAVWAGCDNRVQFRVHQNAKTENSDKGRFVTIHPKSQHPVIQF